MRTYAPRHPTFYTGKPSLDRGKRMLRGTSYVDEAVPDYVLFADAVADGAPVFFTDWDEPYAVLETGEPVFYAREDASEHDTFFGEQHGAKQRHPRGGGRGRRFPDRARQAGHARAPYLPPRQRGFIATSAVPLGILRTAVHPLDSLRLLFLHLVASLLMPSLCLGLPLDRPRVVLGVVLLRAPVHHHQPGPLRSSAAPQLPFT